VQHARFAWTNKSVLRFAGKADPIEMIEAKARELVLRARDSGWEGPPYNPLAIADLLKIPVEANSEVTDARTLAAGDSLKIEFNPTRPRERVRFSIAHELAHTLFSDVAEQTRHRGGSGASSDEWQLEMLCNIAAAEFVMPVGSLPSSDHLPKIEQIMTDRRRFDVSAEAFLIRIIKMTSEPALMFCISPIDGGSDKPNYRLDYVVPSKSASHVTAREVCIPQGSIIYTCTAIGQTNRSTETWIHSTATSVECVGIPGFPGATYPRIAGIIRFRLQDAEADVLKMIHGNVLDPVGNDSKIICQLVNDQARTWGGGVARSTAQKYPTAQRDFTRWITEIPRRIRLGQVHFASVTKQIFVASLVAQEGFGPSSSARIRYAPLERCFSAVAKFASEHNASVHLPRIGMGQSGGSWDTIEEIIRDSLVAKGVQVTVYDLPPSRPKPQASLSFEF